MGTDQVINPSKQRGNTRSPIAFGRQRPSPQFADFSSHNLLANQVSVGTLPDVRFQPNPTPFHPMRGRCSIRTPRSFLESPYFSCLSPWELPPVPSARPGQRDRIPSNNAPYSGSEAGDTGNFGSASREDGEPELPTGSAGRSLWWTWVAPPAGDVQINLLGFTPGSFEELDTVLGVFTGESLTTLTLVAFNDDEPIRNVEPRPFPNHAWNGLPYFGGSEFIGVRNRNGIPFVNLRRRLR